MLTRLAAAAEDLRLLLGRGYGMRESLQLVGNHFRLTKRQRQFLYRCVSPPAAAVARRAKVVPPGEAEGRRLLVDGYNCLIATECLLAGGVVLLSDDGVLRDIEGVFGAFRVSPHTDTALDLLTGMLAAIRPAETVVFLDERMRHAQCVLEGWQRRLSAAELAAHVATVDNADQAIRRDGERAVVASGDRDNMDAAGRVLDLPRAAAASDPALSFVDLRAGTGKQQ